MTALTSLLGPPAGFGNLLALPLERRLRESGHSVFVDERLAPYADQWEFLSTLRRITRRGVEEMVRLAEAKGRVIGVRLAPAEDEDEAAPWLTPPSRRRREATRKGYPEHVKKSVLPI